MGTVTEGVQDPYMVVDKVIANIVSLDNYYDKNLTNHTRNNTGYELAPIKLNGLFEYSLANFSQFDEQLVHYKEIIKPTSVLIILLWVIHQSTY